MAGTISSGTSSHAFTQIVLVYQLNKVNVSNSDNCITLLEGAAVLQYGLPQPMQSQVSLLVMVMSYWGYTDLLQDIKETTHCRGVVNTIPSELVPHSQEIDKSLQHLQHTPANSEHI